MTNLIKTILLILSITLSMAFISCKNDETNPTIKYSDLVGTWTGDAGSFAINSSGYVNFTYGGTTYDNLILDNMDYEFIEGAVSSFNSGYQSHVIPTDNAERKQATFYFHSSSSCSVTIIEQKYSKASSSWSTENTISVGDFTK